MPQIIRIKGEHRHKLLPSREFMGFQLDKHGLYNGQPIQHWLAMAEENVMTVIVRGINEDKNSLVATVTSERLKGLAMALNPSLYYKTVEERDRMRAVIPRCVAHILGHDSVPICEKHRPKTKTKKRKARR